MMRALWHASAGLRRALPDLRPVWRRVLSIEPELLATVSRAEAGGASSISPLAIVEGPVQFGQRVVIEDHAHVVCSVGAGPTPALTLGDDVHIGRFASVICTHSVALGDRVTLGDHAAVTDTWGPATGPMPLDPPPGGGVVVGDDVSVGPGSVVCPGVTVGDGAIVAPHAVVLVDLRPGGRAEGNPASPASVT